MTAAGGKGTGPAAIEAVPGAAGGVANGRIVYSIGYERAALGEVLAVLAGAGVALVLDIRELPLSRRAGFSKRQLQAAVEATGLRYRHLKPLGTPPEGRAAGRRGDWDAFWRIVEARLQGEEAARALDEAAALAAEAPACLICYEGDWRRCHRRRVGELLVERHGFAVRHLALAPG